MPNAAIGKGHLAPLLTPQEQLQVCRWLGEFTPPQRIPDLIKREFGKRVAHHYGYEMLTRKKWQPLIDRHRQDWLVKIMDVPLANKKVRLQELQRLWDNATRPNANPEKQEYRILRILEKARLEMEEKKSDQTTYFFGQFNYANASDDELLQRRAELVKRIEAFRWPTTRRLTDGMGRREGGATTPSTDSEDDGGNGQVGHVEVDVSSERGVGGLDGSPEPRPAGV